MTAEGCRAWRESLGAYVLGHLAPAERAALEAHLEGCPECRSEAEALAPLAGLLPLADPSRLDPAPTPPPGLADRVARQIAAERRGRRRRRGLRVTVALAGAGALAAASLALFVLGGGSSKPTEQVAFHGLPPGVTIGATLEPRPFGTQIRMHVSGVRSGALCQVFLRRADGTRVAAGTFRYRYGGSDEAELSAALDLSRARAVEVRVDRQTFSAPLEDDSAAIEDNEYGMEAT